MPDTFRSPFRIRHAGLLRLGGAFGRIRAGLRGGMPDILCLRLPAGCVAVRRRGADLVRDSATTVAAATASDLGGGAHSGTERGGTRSWPRRRVGRRLRRSSQKSGMLPATTVCLLYTSPSPRD